MYSEHGASAPVFPPGARIVYVRSALGHMSPITGGVALPMILRALRIPVVEAASRDSPIRAM